ncbi:MAG: hypothetical protein QOJ00_157 [Actinomycetota bacterium]|jgi:predicted metal-dependent enzyme (double-stranded beta helix superfamily)
MTFSPTLAPPNSLSDHALELIASGLTSLVDTRPVRFRRGETRRYTELLDTPDYNAWLIAWAPTGALEPHDHGGSRGLVEVIRGRLVESYVDRGEDRAPRSRVAIAGSTLAVPSHRIHEVWNPGPDIAISVHVYSPPLTSMEFFELPRERSA